MRHQTHSSKISINIPGEGDNPLAYLMEEHIKEMVKDHGGHLDYCLYTGEPLVPRPEMSRFRKWLGWKLWGLAGRVNPDVMY